MTRDDLIAFIDGHKLAVLGSVSTANTSQGALVGIAVTPSLELVFDTLSTTRKCANLRNNSACSFVIGCVEEVTLQYEGQAEELVGNELSDYKPIYFEKWPECRAHEAWPEITYFVVRPRWIRFSDYRVVPALIEEFQL